MTRDQRRAQHAFACAQQVAGDERANYKVFVMDFGATILRSGLAVAVTTLEREAIAGRAGAGTFLGHLADAQVPGLANANEHSLGNLVRQLDLPAYVLASRELLRVATWFKRAVEATVPEDHHA